VVGVQQEFLQASCVANDFIWHRLQIAVPPVHILHLTAAGEERHLHRKNDDESLQMGSVDDVQILFYYSETAGP